MLNDPHKGYVRQHMWLPKESIASIETIKNALTFPQDNKSEIKAYKETEHHLLVPRMFLGYEVWRDMGFPIVDQTYDEFPYVQVESTCTLRDEAQRAAFRALINKGSGLLVLSCGKGKTVISIAAWAKLKVPLLVVAHTQELLNQWRERLLEHTTLTEDQIGLYRGKVEDWKKPVCLAMIHTLAARSSSEGLPGGFTEHFGVVVYDEVHHLGAPYFNATAAIGRGIRWGLTATPEREDGLDGLYMGHVGPILYQNLGQDIIPDTYFVQTHLVLPDDVWPTLKDRTGEVNIPKLLTWLSKQVDRNALILNYMVEATHQGREVLALSSRTDHIDMLHDDMPMSSKIHGGVKNKNRDGALYSSKLVFASTQIAKEGLDKSSLDTIALLLPITKKGMFQQILGRVQRVHRGKQHPVLLVFEDEKIPICRNMCAKLKRHLDSMGYPYYIDGGT